MYPVVSLLKLKAHNKLLIPIKFGFTMEDEGSHPLKTLKN